MTSPVDGHPGPGWGPLVIALLSPVILALAFVWWMSPLGLGFATRPQGAAGTVLVGWYWVTLFILTPMMIIGWIAAAVIARNRLIAGIRLAVWTICGWVASVASVMLLW